MKKMLSLWCVSLLCCGTEALAISQDRADSLTHLAQLDLTGLQEVEVKLDDVFDLFDGLVKARKVSVASGVAQDTASAPAVTTLITAQDIEAVGARSLNEALAMVPGLHVGRRGIGYDHIYTLRGIHTNPSPEVLVLLNGIPIKKAHDGRSETDALPASLIQRIEVIRGPGSALYGADAFAGVINIISKTAADIQGTELGVRGGSFNQGELWIAQGQQYGAFDLALMLNWYRSDGHDGWVEEDAQTQLDRLFGSQASLAPGALDAQRDLLHLHLDLGIGDYWRWRGSLRRNQNAGVGLGFGQALDHQAQPDTDSFLTDLTYENRNLSPNWELKAQLSYQTFDSSGNYSLYPPGAFGGAFPDGFLWDIGLQGDQTRVESNALYRGFANHAVRFGAGWQAARLSEVSESRNWGVDLASGFPYPLGSLVDVSNSGEVFLPTATRRNLFAYAQDSWGFSNNWELTAGVRYDDFSDFGNTLNPRLALVWKSTPHLTSKLLFGSAFRAPTLAELGFKNPLIGLGNQSLKAETIDTWELAWDWLVTSDVHMALNLFHYQIKDKIGFPGGQIQYANYGQWRGQGFEWEARWKFSTRAALLFNYAYQNGEDENHQAIADALQQFAYVRLDWMFLPNWFFDFNTRWIADRPRASNDARSALDDYLISDVTLRHKDRKSPWNAAVGIRNLWDTDAREPTTVNIGVTNDLPLPGREWFVELRYLF